MIKKYQIRPFYPDEPRKRFLTIHKQGRVLFMLKNQVSGESKILKMFRVWVTPRGMRRKELFEVPFFFQKIGEGIYSMPSEKYKDFLQILKKDRPMILGFKSKIGNKETNFKLLILDGVKIHTMREDVNLRWKKGLTIQMAYGVRTKFYENFNSSRPDLSKCKSVQEVRMTYLNNVLKVCINDKLLDDNQIAELIKNDGFSSKDDFIQWFFPFSSLKRTWVGRLIHWTDKCY